MQMEDSGLNQEKTGFHIVDHELKFYGVCQQCMEQE